MKENNRTKKFFVKLGMSIILILLFLIVLFFLLQKGIKEFDSDRIALLDKVENNYVFRGNNPLVIKNDKIVFDYDNLTSRFNEILKEQGSKPLTDYYLIDISLLDYDQFFAIRKEKQFFADHPNYGMMINISTLSHILLLNHFSLLNNLSHYSADHYNMWITDNLQRIHQFATQKIDKPVVIYIHCDSGRDRTGLISSSYRLLFKDMGLAQIRPLDLKEVGRSSVVSYDKAIRSYCFYVQKNYNKPDDYCTYVNKKNHQQHQ